MKFKHALARGIPLRIRRSANESPKIIAALKVIPGGMIYLDRFYLDTGSHPAHFVPGKIRGEGPWTIGDGLIEEIKPNTEFGALWAAWQQVREAHSDRYNTASETVAIQDFAAEMGLAGNDRAWRDDTLGAFSCGTTEPFPLPGHGLTHVRKVSVEFPGWSGPIRIGTYGGKPLLDCAGAPIFAELMVLRTLERAGWRGWWIDSYRRKFRRAMPHEDPGITDISESAPAVRYPNAFRSFGGGWDVVVAKDKRVLFFELKRRSKDAIRKSQIQWFEERMKEGAEPEDFVIVEWTLAKART